MITLEKKGKGAKLIGRIKMRSDCKLKGTERV